MGKVRIEDYETGEVVVMDETQLECRRKAAMADHRKVMKRDKDFEERYDYDCSINYNDVLETCYDLSKSGETDKVQEIARKHGGMIALYVKVYYWRRLHPKEYLHWKELHWKELQK